MRRIVTGLAAVAIACTAALVAFLVIMARLMPMTAWFGLGQQPSDQQIEESQRISQIANALGLACGPLVAGALLAVVVILALLAFRWELRRT